MPEQRDAARRPRDRTRRAHLVVRAALIGLRYLLPWLSPKGYKVETFGDTYRYVMMLVVALMGYIHAMIIWAWLDDSFLLPRGLVAGIFLFFALMGNVLGKVRRNFWLGIRTPWTLRSDRVWRRTHQVGSRVMVICGVAMGFSTLLSPPWMVGVVLLTAVAMVVSTIGYSYWIARSE